MNKRAFNSFLKRIADPDLTEQEKLDGCFALIKRRLPLPVEILPEQLKTRNGGFDEAWLECMGYSYRYFDGKEMLGTGAHWIHSQRIGA
jgi:hypothetical protein